MVAGNQPFLDLEEQASQLVDALMSLRTETESYASADCQLREATVAVVSLVSRIGDIADTVKDAALSLREIGTPHLLAEQQALATLINTQRVELQELSSGLAEQSKTTLAEIASRMTHQAAAVESYRAEVMRLISALDQQYKGLNTTLNERLTYQATAVEQIERRTLQIEQTVTALQGSITTHLSSIQLELRESQIDYQRHLDARSAVLMEEMNGTHAGLRDLRTICMICFVVMGFLTVVVIVMLFTGR